MPLSCAHRDGDFTNCYIPPVLFFRSMVLIALFSACFELASLDDTMATNEVSCELACVDDSKMIGARKN
jgi:hypothetical protein